MRGAVSLAAALSLPLTLDSGASFVDRDLLAFITIAVIFSTLVLQGLTLPAIIRWTGLDRSAHSPPEEIKARIAIATAALDRIDEIVLERPNCRRSWSSDTASSTSTGKNGGRACCDGTASTPEQVELFRSLPDLRRQLIDAERQELISRRNRGLITIETYRQLEHELDLDESRIIKLPPRV